MKKRFLTVAALAILVGTASVSGYLLNGPKWAVQQVPYYINPVNADMPQADAIAAIQAGAAAWSAQSNANILPYYMGQTTGSSLTLNGKNEIFFRNGSSGSLYGETLWWYNGANQLFEADIVFYDATYTFYGGSSVCSSGVYLQDATTHEFGHVLGLGHSADPAASMYPSMTWCSSSIRTLDVDDVAGIEALYPATVTNSTPIVSISTPSSGSSFSEGSAIGFTGSAVDNEDGSLGSSMVWRSNLDGQIGSGAAFERVLTPGNHTITARVTDSAGAVAEAQRTVTVQANVSEPPPPSGFVLSARGYKVKGNQRVDLSWSGSSAVALDVYRDGARIAITPNTGSYADPLNRKGGGSYTYLVCAERTTTCSNSVKVTF